MDAKRNWYLRDAGCGQERLGGGQTAAREVLKSERAQKKMSLQTVDIMLERLFVL